MYPNRPPDYGLKRFFYQTLGWHWSSEDGALRRRNQSPYYISSGNLTKSTKELSLDDNDMPGLSLEKKLMYEEGYYRHRLQMNAIDAILHRISPETKAWLNGGPRPQRHILVSLASRSYRTRGKVQSIKAKGASSSQPSSSRALPPRVLPWRGCLDPLDPIAIEDSNSD